MDLDPNDYGLFQMNNVFQIEMRSLEEDIQRLLEEKMREVKLAAWQDATAERAAHLVEIGHEIEITTGRILTTTESPSAST